LQSRTKSSEFNKFNKPAIVVDDSDSAPEQSTIVSRKLDFSSPNAAAVTKAHVIAKAESSDSDSGFLDLKNPESRKKFVASVSKTNTTAESKPTTQELILHQNRYIFINLWSSSNTI
jgi:hypothetical protein